MNTKRVNHAIGFASIFCTICLIQSNNSTVTAQGPNPPTMQTIEGVIESITHSRGRSHAVVSTAASDKQRLVVRDGPGWYATTMLPASLQDVPVLRAMKSPPGADPSLYDGEKYRLRFEADAAFEQVANTSMDCKLTNDLVDLTLILVDSRRTASRRNLDGSVDEMWLHLNNHAITRVGNAGQRFKFISGPLDFDDRFISFQSSYYDDQLQKYHAVQVSGSIGQEARITFAVYDPMLRFARPGDRVFAQGFSDNSVIMAESMTVFSSESYRNRLPPEAFSAVRGRQPQPMAKKFRTIEGTIESLGGDRIGWPTSIRVTKKEGGVEDLRFEYETLGLLGPNLQRYAKNTIINFRATVLDLADFVQNENFEISFVSQAVFEDLGKNGLKYEQLRSLFPDGKPPYRVYEIQNVPDVFVKYSPHAGKTVGEIGNKTYAFVGKLAVLNGRTFSLDTYQELFSVKQKTLVKGTFAEKAKVKICLCHPAFVRKGDEVSAEVWDLVRGEEIVQTTIKKITIEAAEEYGVRKTEGAASRGKPVKKNRG